MESVKSIEESLRMFTEVETLSKDNKVDCEGCKRRCQVTKGLSITDVPSGILCIHLKRFSYNMYGRLQKNSKRISFPSSLDLGAYLTTNKKTTKYNLFALIIHMGSSCNSGHYISYVKRNGLVSITLTFVYLHDQPHYLRTHTTYHITHRRTNICVNTHTHTHTHTHTYTLTHAYSAPSFKSCE